MKFIVKPDHHCIEGNFCLLMILTLFSPAFGQQKAGSSGPEKDLLKKVKVNNTTLNFIEKGKGEPIVFVHGTLGDYRTWEAQTGQFVKDYRVISYSRRYHYPNPWPKGILGFSVSVHAKDLIAFIQALKLERAHVIGHSFGAYVALMVAKEKPELVQSLILAEPPIMPLISGASRGNSLIQSFMNNSIIPSRKAFEKGNEENGIKQFVNGILGDGAYRKLPPTAHIQMKDNVRELKGEVYAMGNNLFPSFPCEDAVMMQVPTLLINGERSLEIFDLVNDVLEKCMPNNERAVVADASHEMQSDNPKVFNKIVLTFLRSIDAALEE